MTRYEIGGCPVCGAVDAHVIATADDIRDEIEQLWAFHTRRLRADTPPAALHDRLAFSQEPPLHLVRCNHCTLLYRNPRERERELVEAYTDEEPDRATLQTLFDTQRTAFQAQARRLTRLAGTGTGLEVGSYVGAFLDAARAAGWDFTGIDINETANGFARAHGFDIRNGTIENIADNGRYDAVVFWNCFDQLPDPRAALAAARRSIRPGGWVAVRVPNGAFYASWRARLHSPARALARAVLAHNNLLAFPYRHGFSTRSLERLFADLGFRIQLIVGDALVLTADRWTRHWARIEERLLKTALGSLPAPHAPWLELYARAA